MIIKHKVLGIILLKIKDEVERGADLRGADLRGADLRGADLLNATIRDVDLRDADLRGADLRGADLKGTNLRGADLRGADLEGVNLRGADLEGANLRGADLKDVDLRGANLLNAIGCYTFRAGTYNRLCVAVGHNKGTMFKLGCHYGNLESTLEVIETKYGKNSNYGKLCSIYADMLENNNK